MERKFLIQSSALALLLLSFLLVACEQEDLEELDPIPVLELVSINPMVAQEFTDSVVIVLDYTDGDGDLGGLHPDSVNLFVEDSRIDLVYEYRIPELVPNGAAVPIKGSFRVVISSLFRVDDTQTSEKLSFNIYAFDRAGNKSNVLITPEIEVQE